MVVFDLSDVLVSRRTISTLVNNKVLFYSIYTKLKEGTATVSPHYNESVFFFFPDLLNLDLASHCRAKPDSRCCLRRGLCDEGLRTNKTLQYKTKVVSLSTKSSQNNLYCGFILLNMITVMLCKSLL